MRRRKKWKKMVNSNFTYDVTMDSVITSCNFMAVTYWLLPMQFPWLIMYSLINSKHSVLFHYMLGSLLGTENIKLNIMYLWCSWSIKCHVGGMFSLNFSLLSAILLACPESAFGHWQSFCEGDIAVRELKKFLWRWRKSQKRISSTDSFSKKRVMGKGWEKFFK